MSPRKKHAPKDYWVPSSSGTENSAKAFSFLNTRSDFLTVAAVAALLATPSAALGDSVSSASVAPLPTRGDDVLADHGGSVLFPRAGHSPPGFCYPGGLRLLPPPVPPPPPPHTTPPPLKPPLATIS